MLLLTGNDIAGLMRPADYLAAVDRVFRANREGRANAPSPLKITGRGGAFHAKGAWFDGERPYVALKLNGNFPGNTARGLPTIQGALLLCDGGNGSMLALMDSIEITLRRTAAATAFAAGFLARRNAETVCIAGCGAQALAQLEALAGVRALRHCFAFDLDAEKAQRFAQAAGGRLDMTVEAAANLREATLRSDIVVTCTTSKSPILGVEDVARGTFVAAVGADSPDKSEISPALMVRATIVADVLDQCVEMGDLKHAIDDQMVERAHVRELCDLIGGAALRRSSDEEIIVFDSTGSALQDVASGALVYERAIAAGVGKMFALAEGEATGG